MIDIKGLVVSHIITFCEQHRFRISTDWTYGFIYIVLSTNNRITDIAEVGDSSIRLYDSIDFKGQQSRAVCFSDPNLFSIIDSFLLETCNKCNLQ